MIPHDPLLVEALSFAMAKKPCVIVCRNIVSMDIAYSYLHSVSPDKAMFLRGETPADKRNIVIQAYNIGLLDYLVLNVDFACTGLRFTRESGYVASSLYLRPQEKLQLASRYDPRFPHIDPDQHFLIERSPNDLAT